MKQLLLSIGILAAGVAIAKLDLSGAVKSVACEPAAASAESGRFHANFSLLGRLQQLVPGSATSSLCEEQEPETPGTGNGLPERTLLIFRQFVK